MILFGVISHHTADITGMTFLSLYCIVCVINGQDHTVVVGHIVEEEDGTFVDDCTIHPVASWGL